MTVKHKAQDRKKCDWSGNPIDVGADLVRRFLGDIEAENLFGPYVHEMRAFCAEEIPMDSIQSDVRKWHESVFGREFSIGRVTRTAMKTLEEAAELYCATREVGVVRDVQRRVLMEAADVAITCYAIACINGVSLDVVIRDRLAILRSRPDQRGRDRKRGHTRDPLATMKEILDET